MGERSLEELAQRAASGDSDALSRVVEEVQHPVYRLALRFLGHPEDAKDASQEILVRVVTNLGSFEGRSQFMTWVYTVAVRQLMRTRKRGIEASIKGPEAFAAFLDRGLAERDFTAEEAEYRLLCAEVRISCTYGLLLCLSRPLRASYILGDAIGLPDTAAAEICEISRAASVLRVRAGPCGRSSPTVAASSTRRTRAAVDARSRAAWQRASWTAIGSCSRSMGARMPGRSRPARSSEPPRSSIWRWP